MTLCHTENPACDDNPKSQHPDAEHLLIQAIRRWELDSRAGEHELIAKAEQHIKTILERFIGDCLSHDPSSRLRGWWSDGVTYLRVKHQANRTFNLRGTTWIGSDGIAPFDFELVLPDDEGRHFDRIRFRIGLLDELGCPTLCDPGWAVDRVLERCPRYNRDWAMAIELTPPKQE